MAIVPDEGSYQQQCDVLGTFTSAVRIVICTLAGLLTDPDSVTYIMANLKSQFEAFAGFGTRQATSEIDGAKFAKLFRECKLLDKAFSATDCDLIFSKVKPKGARKIGFTGYEAALKLVAEKKGIEYDALVAKVLAAGGPASSGTQAEQVKFHDDKSLYTGVYKNGGPTNVDNGTADLSNITDRTAADVRGVKK